MSECQEETIMPRNDQLLIPVLGDGDIQFLSELNSHLVGKEFNPVFLADDHNIESDMIHNVGRKSVLMGLSNHEPEKPLDELINKYDISSPRSFVITEMAYDYRYPKPSSQPYLFTEYNSDDFTTYISKLHRCLDFLDQLYQEKSHPVPVQNQGGEILRRTLQVVADHHNIPSIWIGFSPIDGKSGLYQNESEFWETIERSSYYEMTDDEISRAETFVERYRSKKGGISSGGYNRSLIESIRQKFQIFRRHATEPNPVIERWVRNNIFKRIMAIYSRQKYSNFEESTTCINNHEYVFYPLQYYRESRILVRSPAFYKQSWIIEYLSRSLPLNHELIVKDHPKQLGAQPKAEVDSIIQHSHVLDPDYPIRPILKNASVVVVLNNTVGYEAILHGKPVVTLGSGFYTNSDHIYTVEDINNLPTVLERAIKSGGPREREILAFANGVIEGSYEGVWGDKSKNNLDRLGDSLRTYYNSMIDNN